MTDLLEGLNGPSVCLFSPQERTLSQQTASSGANPEGISASSQAADVVTLDPEREVAPTLPRGLSDLYAVLDQMGVGRRSSGSEASSRSGNGLGRSASQGFSPRSAFANSRSLGLGGGVGGGRINNLLNRLDKGFDKLMSLDPVLGGHLAVLLRALAVLDPENADQMLETLADTLDSLANLTGAQTASTPDLSQVARQAQPAQTNSGQQASAQVVHFELDFEMEMSSVTETTVAELRDQGIQVQTTRLEQYQRVSIHVEFTGVLGQGQNAQKQSDPLVLDLGNDGVQLSSAADGEAFDINADGTVDRTAFVRGNDAYLALDRNGNGQIDDGGELFGDQHGARNGFEELARFDDNREGFIDKNDSVFKRLRLLYDRNGDNQVGRSEWSSLTDQGIEAIDLRYQQGNRVDDTRGNSLAERSAYIRSNGQRGQVFDAWVGYA
jgi:hypothetical protein